MEGDGRQAYQLNSFQKTKTLKSDLKVNLPVSDYQLQMLPYSKGTVTSGNTNLPLKRLIPRVFACLLIFP